MQKTITFEVWGLENMMYEDDWFVNNQMRIGEVTTPEFFTTRKLFSELRKHRFLPGTWTKIRFQLDDTYATDGVWYVNSTVNGKPFPELRLIMKGGC